MHRRAVGALVVIVTIFGAMVASSLIGRPVAGFASAERIPPVPQVGDCLTEAEPGWGERLRRGGAALPFVPTAPCAGARLGEIITVYPDWVEAAAVSLNENPPAVACVTDALVHVGGPGSDAPATAQAWQRTVSVLGTLVGPDARQRAVGHRWAACLAYPSQFEGVAPQVVNGSLRGAGRGPDAPLFAVCTDDDQGAIGQFRPCGVPHRSELLGSRPLAGTVGRGELDQSCRDLAAQVTGMPDVTAGGSLTVRAYLYASTEDPRLGEAEGLPDDGFAVCAATPADPTRRLTASLLGLGTGPVPLL